MGIAAPAAAIHPQSVKSMSLPENTGREPEKGLDQCLGCQDVGSGTDLDILMGSRPVTLTMRMRQHRLCP